MLLKNSAYFVVSGCAEKNNAIRRAIGDRWPRGKHFLSPSRAFGSSQESFSTVSVRFATARELNEISGSDEAI
jgi:hypothetical protein